MQQGHIAEDAAHAPHVLIFQIAAVAPAQYHDRQAVLTGPQDRREIEFGRQPAVLGIAHPPPVAPQMKRRVHAVKDDAGLPALKPRVIHIKCERVTAGWVLLRHKRRINGDRIGDVGVDGRVKPLHLPVRRHGHRNGVRTVFGYPRLRDLLGCRKVVKSPHPIEGASAGGCSIIQGRLFKTPAV